MRAYGALITFGGMQRGDFVLITAVSSSVGLAAIQMANLEGAIPTAATRKAAKRDELLSLRAAHVVVTEEEDRLHRLFDARLSMQPTPFPICFRSSEDGRFHPKIAKPFPLAQSKKAYQYLESNQQVGTVVITI
jgi:NADPH:quinone reductase-like Zn-dependent oxidoreductase